MRVAVTISGHLRRFEEGHNEICRFLLDPNPDCQFDFFVHTWDLLDWRTEEKFQKTTTIINHFNDLYTPKNIVIQESIEWNTEKFMKFVKNERWVKKGYGGKRSRGEHIPSMFYKMFKSNQLKCEYENLAGFKYDLEVRHRTDLSILKPINLSALSNIEKTIYVPDCDQKAKDGGINLRDVFAIGTSGNMNYYNGVFPLMTRLVQQTQIFRPEVLLEQHLKNIEDITVDDVTIGSWRVL